MVEKTKRVYQLGFVLDMKNAKLTILLVFLVAGFVNFAYAQVEEETSNSISTETQESSQEASVNLSSEFKKLQDTNFIFWDQIFNGETPFDVGIFLDTIFENTSLTDVILFSIGMVIYGIFIWHFYQLIARRDIISIGEEKIHTGARAVRISVYVLKYLIVFPLIIFVWFFVYSMFMFFLAPEVEIKFVFMVVISLVIAIRISAYYKEDLAKDLAKMIPFAILGIFLSTGIFFTTDQLQERVSELVPFVLTVVQFVIIAILVEAILRVLYLIKKRVVPTHKEDLEPLVGKKVADKIEDMVEEEVKEKLENTDKNNGNKK